MIGGCRRHGGFHLPFTWGIHVFTKWEVFLVLLIYCGPGLLFELVFKYDNPVFLCMHCGVFELNRSGTPQEDHHRKMLCVPRYP